MLAWLLSVADADSRVAVRSLTVLSGEDSRTETSQESAGQQHQIPNMKHSSGERNLVNVVFIDDRMHDRNSFEDENEGGAESDRAFHDSPLPAETRLNERL